MGALAALVAAATAVLLLSCKRVLALDCFFGRGAYVDDSSLSVVASTVHNYTVCYKVSGYTTLPGGKTVSAG